MNQKREEEKITWTSKHHINTYKYNSVVYSGKSTIVNEQIPYAKMRLVKEREKKLNFCKRCIILKIRCWWWWWWRKRGRRVKKLILIFLRLSRSDLLGIPKKNRQIDQTIKWYFVCQHFFLLIHNLIYNALA